MASATERSDQDGQQISKTLGFRVSALSAPLFHGICEGFIRVQGSMSVLGLKARTHPGLESSKSLVWGLNINGLRELLQKCKYGSGWWMDCPCRTRRAGATALFRCLLSGNSTNFHWRESLTSSISRLDSSFSENRPERSEQLDRSYANYVCA